MDIHCQLQCRVETYFISTRREDAPDVLEEYYKKLGGRPQKPTAKPGPKAGPGRKRKATADSKSVTPSATAAEPKRRRKSAKDEETPPETEGDEDKEDWVPKGKDWDQELRTVDTIIRDPESGGLFAFLLWNNGKRSRVSIESCYEKCPRKVSRHSLGDWM